jgi:hypothetical protein
MVLLTPEFYRPRRYKKDTRVGFCGFWLIDDSFSPVLHIGACDARLWADYRLTFHDPVRVGLATIR